MGRDVGDAVRWRDGARGGAKGRHKHLLFMKSKECLPLFDLLFTPLVGSSQPHHVLLDLAEGPIAVGTYLSVCVYLGECVRVPSHGTWHGGRGVVVGGGRGSDALVGG